MDRTEFQSMLQGEFDRILELNTTKGNDYAGNEDALANFKNAAVRLGLTPEQVWGVYADKHWSAIMTYCKDGQVESEPIEGRIRDAVLYLLLLMGLVIEKNAEGNAAVRTALGDT